MIAFQTLPDDHQDLRHSPLLRGALLTLGYAQDHGGIGLTAAKAVKRDFVCWAAEHFEWPGHTAGELLRVQRVLNEADFQPLELVHFLLIRLRLARHRKGKFLVTKEGVRLLAHPGQLFEVLARTYIFSMDHAAYSRTGDDIIGNWDTWLNVMNAEIEPGISERDLFGVFYGHGPAWDNDGWRQIAAFSACVLKPLEWAGLITLLEAQSPGSRFNHMVFKTPLWSAFLKLEADADVVVVTRH